MTANGVFIDCVDLAIRPFSLAYLFSGAGSHTRWFHRSYISSATAAVIVRISVAMGALPLPITKVFM